MFSNSLIALHAYSFLKSTLKLSYFFRILAVHKINKINCDFENRTDFKMTTL